MGLDLSHGGHLTHGCLVNSSGILYNPCLLYTSALLIIKKLEEEGAIITYYDPYIPEFMNNEKKYQSLKNLTSKQIAGKDIVVIITDHTNVNYGIIIENARIIFDTRNAPVSYTHLKNSNYKYKTFKGGKICMNLLYIAAQIPWGKGEAFVLEEMIEVKKQGISLLTIPRNPPKEIFHKRAESIINNAIWLPLINIETVSYTHLPYIILCIYLCYLLCSD